MKKDPLDNTRRDLLKSAGFTVAWAAVPLSHATPSTNTTSPSPSQLKTPAIPTLGCPNVDPLAPLEPPPSLPDQGAPENDISCGSKPIIATASNSSPAKDKSSQFSSFAEARTTLSGMAIRRNHIDAGITIREAVPSVSSEFRYHQVEQLLSQAATLLERGIATRTEDLTLGEKSFTTWLELKEFDDLEAIHEKEVTAGFYAFPTLQSAAASKAEDVTATTAAEACWYAANVWNKPEVPKATNEHTGEVVRPPIDMTNEERGNKIASVWSYSGQALAARARATASAAKATYDNCNIGFRRARTEAARRINAMKMMAFTEQSGALNYEARRQPLRVRFCADFRDACTRLSAIRLGLKNIYGYDWQIADTGHALDDAIIAVREAMEWLVRFSGQEQNYVFPVSLRAVAAWSLGLGSDKRSGAWDFEISANLFPQQRNVRLRGVSVTVDSSNGGGLFQAIIRVPQRGMVTYLDGSVSQQPGIDQSMVPIIRIGRIQRLDSPRSPDVVGLMALHNVSPIGKWRLGVTSAFQPMKITDNPANNESMNATLLEPTVTNSTLNDVIIYLHLAVRSVLD